MWWLLIFRLTLKYFKPSFIYFTDSPFLDLDQIFIPEFNLVTDQSHIWLLIPGRRCEGKSLQGWDNADKVPHILGVMKYA